MSDFKPESWRKPAPLAYGPALDAVTTIAAPLLAGFSITVIAAVAASSEKFRWPGIALLALTVAAVLLVASLQLGFYARQHLYSAADVADWWTPEYLEESHRAERRQREQQEDFARWKKISSKARTTYNIGITILALGVASVLVPLPSASHSESSFRWAAAAVATMAALGELAWSTVPMLRRWLERRRLKRSYASSEP